MATEAKVTAVIEAKDNASSVFDSFSNRLALSVGKFELFKTAAEQAFGALTKIANDTAEFNQWITRAGTNVGATAMQMDEFRKIAIKATADTNYNATQAAEALYNLAGGTIDAQDAMTGLQQSVKFAQANGIDDLSDAVKTTASVMTLFKLRGDDVGKAMDVMTRAGQDSYATTQQMSEAFQEAAPEAATLGVSIEETAAMLAALGDQGRYGTEAGVILKRAMEQLAAPTGQAADGLKALGVVTKDSAGNFRGLAPILDDMQKGLDKVGGNADKAAILSDIFGQIAGPGMMALLNSGKESRDSYIADMHSAAGATQSAADANQAAVNPVNELNNQFFAIETELAKGVNPMLQALVDMIKIVEPYIKDVFTVTVGALGDAFYGVERAANAAYNAIKAVANAKSSAQTTLQNFGGSIAKAASNLLSFDQGGYVPGPVGAPVMAVVHGGEYVVPNGGSRAGGGAAVNVTVTGNTISSELDMSRLADLVGREVMRSLRMAQQI